MRHHPQTQSSSRLSKGLELGVVVGIDPGLDGHGVVALVASSCSRLARHKIPNTVASMQILAERLAEWKGQGGGRLTVAIEEATAYGEALACYLSQAGFPVVVVNALKVARFKEIIGVDANDLTDAEAVARLLIAQPDLGRPTARELAKDDPHAGTHRRLRQLSRRHGRWTREQTALTNELHAVLRMAWLAEYQAFFSRITGAAALAFWQTCPTPAEAAATDPQTIAALLRQASHGRFSEAVASEKARHIHHTATLLVAALGRKDPQRWSAWAEDIRALAQTLAHLTGQLKQLEKTMAKVLEEIKTPLTSFQGLGTVTAATIHGETLSVDRFATADRFARFNGTAPREDSSGRRPRHVKNHACNKRLKRVLLQLALNAPRYHALSAAYLERLQARGITGGAARLRLSRRLSDVIYAMLRDQRPYDLGVHLEKKQQAA